MPNIKSNNKKPIEHHAQKYLLNLQNEQDF